MDTYIHNKMKEICSPLLGLGITFFQYIETSEEGHMTFLCNNMDWYRYYACNQLFNISNFKNKPAAYESGYVLNNHMPVQEGLVDVAEKEFNIAHGITFIEPGKRTCKFFMFCAQKNNKDIVHFFISNISLLKRFILHFKDKADSLISISKRFAFKIDSQGYKRWEENPYKLSPSKLNKFLEVTPINRFFIGDNLYLTKREAECLAWLAVGKTSSEIGMILNISQRTVEAHINNLKRKLNCCKQSQLAHAAAQLNVQNLLAS